MMALLGVLTMLLAATAAPGCPPPVLRTYPAQGTLQPPGERIGADLDFTVGPGGDLASLRLVVDGADVTSRATVVASRDWPPSRVALSHVDAGLAPGHHRAEIRFRGGDGRALSCSWSFVRQP